jgi:rubrerythrin
MEQQTSLGFNRTGIEMSPVDAQRMQSPDPALAVEDETPDTVGEDYLTVRQAYAVDDGLGSVPVPANMKGMVKSGVQMVTGKRPQVFIDKLGERLAFERGGVRLYDTLLGKCEVWPDVVPEDTMTELRRFRDEEAQHFLLVKQALEQIGADPTAQTPCADLVGVESAGLVQAMNDPRTNVLQSLHVMLDAELLDNAGWEMLVELARSVGQDDIAQSFQTALHQEATHLSRLRMLVSALTANDAGSEPADEVAEAAS